MCKTRWNVTLECSKVSLYVTIHIPRLPNVICTGQEMGEQVRVDMEVWQGRQRIFMKLWWNLPYPRTCPALVHDQWEIAHPPTVTSAVKFITTTFATVCTRQITNAKRLIELAVWSYMIMTHRIALQKCTSMKHLSITAEVWTHTTHEATQ
jgi:hypothetical protein